MKREEIEGKEAELLQQVVHFLESANVGKDTTYKDKLAEKIRKGRNHLVIDFKILMRYDVELADVVLDHPEFADQLFQDAVKSIEDEADQYFNCRFKNLPESTEKGIYTLRHSHIGMRITVEGMVKQKSDIQAKALITEYECTGCMERIHIKVVGDFKKPPRVCPGCRNKYFKEIESTATEIYTLQLEEPPDKTESHKLAKIHIVCYADLANRNVEQKIIAGRRVKVSGILKELVKSAGGKKKAQFGWYLEANYIEMYGESYEATKWTPEEEERFYELARDEKWLEKLTGSIFVDIVGLDQECRAVTLQMFGAYSSMGSVVKDRGVINILLVGDPGEAKSAILKIAQAHSPKAMYVSGAGTSLAGLTGTVVKDELTGGFTLECGAIVLCHKGLICLDELDKVDKEVQRGLNEPLEQQTVSINKASIQTTLQAETAVLAAANPKDGKYDDYDSIYNQINFDPTFLSRFDFIFPIKTRTRDPGELKRIARAVNRRTRDEKDFDLEYDKTFIKKYIAFARTIYPTFTEDANEYTEEKYKDISLLEREEAAKFPITPRLLTGAKRIAIAIARSRLSSNVDVDDVKLAWEMMETTLAKIGFAPEDGAAPFLVTPEEDFGKKIVVNKKTVWSIIRKTLREYSSGNKGEPMAYEELQAVLENKFDVFEPEALEEAIEKLLRSGDIMEPRRGKYQLVG